MLRKIWEKICFRHFATFYKTFTIYVAWSMAYLSAINEISNEPSNLIKQRNGKLTIWPYF